MGKEMAGAGSDLTLLNMHRTNLESVLSAATFHPKRLATSREEIDGLDRWYRDDGFGSHRKLRRQM